MGEISQKNDLFGRLPLINIAECPLHVFQPTQARDGETQAAVGQGVRATAHPVQQGG